MDQLFDFAKQNYQLITLLVGVLGVVVAAIAVIYELKDKKRSNKKKDAQRNH